MILAAGLSVCCIIFSVCAVISRSSVGSSLYLFLSQLILAGIFLDLGHSFLAIVYSLIVVGMLIIYILVGVSTEQENKSETSRKVVWPLVVMGLFLGLIVLILGGGFLVLGKPGLDIMVIHRSVDLVEMYHQFVTNHQLVFGFMSVLIFIITVVCVYIYNSNGMEEG